MGRKKKPKDEEEEEQPREEPRNTRRDDDDDDSSSSVERERRHYDIDNEIQELAYAFGIDATLTQRLNDIMIEERKRTWDQDLARLHEILKEAHTPAAMLNLKLRDMEKGTFVGKAKCGPRVREMAKRHRLDKGAASKLEEAMSMREAMGKDVEKDIQLLNEHLEASNAPSKLISMKLESMRKGYNIGHCIYSREPMPGNQGPGVDGVFNKRDKRPLGYTDADLDKRFADLEGASKGGALMDEATVRKMMAAEKKQHMAKVEETTKKESKKSRRSRSGSRGRSRSVSRGRKKKRSRSRDASRSPRGKKDKEKEKSRRSPSAKRKRSRSKSQKRKRTKSRSPKRKVSRGRSRSRDKKKRARSSSSGRTKSKRK